MMLQKIKEASDYIKSHIKNNPKVGIVLGSGLGIYTEEIQNKITIQYSSIPHFRQTSVEGHQGALIFGQVHGVDVIALQGRFHAYEGYTMEEVVFPIRVLKQCGVEYLFLSNASGGINEKFHPGNLVLIEDHINLSGKNPLVGENLKELGPRFPDMSSAYDANLREIIFKEAQKINIQMFSGIYCSVLGPSYETPAEVRMLRILGADMVGMSTVSEVIAAHHMDMKVVAVACITNYAAGIKKEKLSHSDVKKVAEKAMVNFAAILSETIKELKNKKLVS